MPAVERRGKRWRAIAFHDGRKIAAGTHDTKAAALAAAVDVERKAAAGEIAAARGKTLRDVFDRYADEVSPTKRGERFERLRLAFYARDPIAATPLARLTTEHFDELRARRLIEVEQSTFERDLVLIGHALKLARERWHWMEHSPMRGMRRAKAAEMPPRTRRLGPGEIEALRIASGYRPDAPPRTATARVIAAFEFAVETAMRGGEILALVPIDCHKTHVRVRESKNGEPRDVPLSPRAREILDQVRALKLQPVFGLTTAHKDALFRKIRRRAGIEGLNFHDSRREATTRLARIFDVLELSRITGHRDLRILRDVYYRPDVEELAGRMG
jgi:integrase